MQRYNKKPRLQLVYLTKQNEMSIKQNKIIIFVALHCAAYIQKAFSDSLKSNLDNSILNGKSETLSLAIIWASAHDIAESVSRIHSYSFRGSPEPDFRIRAKEAHAFFLFYHPV